MAHIQTDQRRITVEALPGGVPPILLDVSRQDSHSTICCNLTVEQAKALIEALQAAIESLPTVTAAERLGLKAGDVVSMPTGPGTLVGIVAAYQEPEDGLRVRNIAGPFPDTDDTWYTLDKIKTIGRAC